MKTMLSLAVCLGLAAPASAGDVSSFFSRLYKALTTDTASRFANRGMKLSAVAAVRGAPLGEQDPADVYWKGGMTEEAAKQQAAERQEFASAVQFAMDGKMAESTAALEKFEKDHPKSSLLPDVKEALAKTKEGAADQTKEAAGALAAKTPVGEPPPEGCSGETLKAEKPCDVAKAPTKPEKK